MNRLFICVAVLHVYVALGVVTDAASISPESSLVPKDKNTTLSCVITGSPSTIRWTTVFANATSSTAGYTTIAENCNGVLPEFQALYTASVRNNECDLKIINAQAAHGKRYVCFGPDNEQSDQASLSVIESNVTGSLTSQVAAPNDVIVYTCSIVFYGSVSPSFSWQPSSQSPNSTVVINDTVRWETSTIYVTMPQAPATVDRVCRVADWDASWSSVYFWSAPTVNVSYCPRNVQVVGASNGSSVTGGTVLTCQSDGYPVPQYTWTNMVDNSSVSGQQLTVDSKKYYNLTCTVMGNLTFANGTVQPCSQSIYFQVDGFGVSGAGVTAVLYTPLMVALIGVLLSY